MTCTFNSSIQEVKLRRSLWVQGQKGLHSKFMPSLNQSETLSQTLRQITFSIHKIMLARTSAFRISMFKVQFPYPNYIISPKTKSFSFAMAIKRKSLTLFYSTPTGNSSSYLGSFTNSLYPPSIPKHYSYFFDLSKITNPFKSTIFQATISKIRCYSFYSPRFMEKGYYQDHFYLTNIFLKN